MKKTIINKMVLLLVMSIVLTQSALAISVSLLSTDPAPLQAGEFADITVRIDSSINEDAYEEVNFIIEETNFIKPISTTQQVITNLQSGDSATKTYRIFLNENLPSGFVDIEFTVETERGTFEYKERVFVRDADSRPELYIGSIQSTPKELLPDTDDNKITITLQNLGDKDAELVKATLNSDAGIIKPSYSFSLEDSVASINSGEEADLTFTIDTEETTENEIPSTLELHYRAVSASGNDYETLTTIIPFNLEIIDAPLLKVVEINQVDSFVGGTTENEVLIGIKNEGNTDAEEVRVRLVPDVSYPFIFELTTQYVSSKIEPGETVFVSFSAEVQSSAKSREYPITAKLESLIGETRYVREDVVNLEAMPGKEMPIKSISLTIIAIIVLVGAIIGIRSYKSRKKTYRAKRR